MVICGSNKMKVWDTLHNGNGELLAGGEPHEIIGDVEVIHKSRSGRKVFTRKLWGKNDLLVTGGVFLSEKINNIRSSFKTTPLDLQFGVHRIEDIDTTSATVPQEQVVGIMVGNGGCGDTYNTVNKVRRTDRHVPGPLPLRVRPLDSDLTGPERDRYLLRVVKGDYVYYYGKKFTIDREINVMYEDGTVVPTNVDLIGPTKFIKMYTKYTAILDESDIREGFKISQGSTRRSLVNSVGLITGYLGEVYDQGAVGLAPSKIPHQEAYNVRGMTTLNTENCELKDSESTITYIYRLYFT